MKNYKIYCITVLQLVFLSLIVNANTVTVNSIRNFIVDSNTIISLDGVAGGQSLFEIVGTGGYKIRFRVADDVNPTISAGTLSEIHLISDIKGPITSLQPLTILGQEVFTTGDTVYKNIGSDAKLVPGDIVAVSGIINAIDNSMQLSRLELDNSIDQWKLRGFARNINANTFTIGGLVVNKNLIPVDNCNNGFNENTFVSIEALTDLNYDGVLPLDTLLSITCESPDVDQDSNNSVPVVVEGFVSGIIDLAAFEINNLDIFITVNTDFDNGETEHIDIGTKLEVQGTLDTNTRQITATTIRFVDHRVKMVAPVNPSDITIGNSMLIFGKLVSFIPQTRDDDDIVTMGLTTSKQIEIRGFTDSQGNIFAQRVRDKGDVDSEDVTLRGDVTDINQPMIKVNNIEIDASSSTFELNDGTATIQEFFSVLMVGMQLSIEDASYNQMSNVLSLGNIEIAESEIDDDPDNAIPTQPLSKLGNTINEIVGTGGVGIATITIAEPIFSSGFE